MMFRTLSGIRVTCIAASLSFMPYLVASVLAQEGTVGVLPAPDLQAQGARYAPVPPIVIPVRGQLLTAAGDPRLGTVRVRVGIFAYESGGEPLWVEEQDLVLDAAGAYVVSVGGATRGGVPAAVFATGEARWVAVGPVGEPDGPRGRLQTVPYAAKAATADALAGAPADAYVRTDDVVARVMAALRLLQKEQETGGGFGGGVTLSLLSSTTPNALAKFLDTSGTVGDSTVHEVNGKVGVGLPSPNYRLDVAGDLRLTGNHAGGNLIHFNPTGAGEQWELYPETTGFSVFNRTDGATRLHLDNNGNVGIGITPSYRLDVAGALRLTGNHAGTNLIHFNPTGAGEQWELYPQVDGFSVFNRTDGATRLHVDNAGNLGVGTTMPTARLDVAGSGVVNGALTVTGATTLTGGVTGSLNATGNITATGTISGGNIVAKYQDVAEWVEAVESLPPGTVVAADPSSLNKVRRSQRAYDTAVLGVVSAQPGVLLGEAGEGKVAVTQSGRVLVKVDARYGRIKPGDLLVASPTPGVAMRSRPGSTGGVHRPGTIIGKALQGLAKGTGEILVLITLQ